MDAKQKMELTVRTSMLMKSVAQMIGVTNTLLARLLMVRITEAAMELDKFIETCK